ncbi:golgin subfamily A member 1-like isoform X1 [Macrobrachium rosenbergii]|uniref:golgin subfamily A member 1-like isoform X1 n=1 Tax=Macrobrachium rosenbergii TaxID=79674 RepID=UPI0034D5C813
MFGNLKNKIGDVTDLKKLTSPQALASMAGGSRQRSSTHTPGSMTPRSRHSRQASTASLQGLGLPISPPRSPTDSSELALNHDRVQELEREVSKLRTALETQQDSALERINAREQEWRAKLQEEKNKVNALERNLEEGQKREQQLQQQIDGFSTSKKQTAEQLKDAQGLEAKVIEMQDNCDQMEGLNTQEMAKIKHMLLNTNGELETLKIELKTKSEALSNAEARLNSVAALEDRVRMLSEEKTELESTVAGLNHKLSTLNTRYTSLEDSKGEEVRHLQERIATLEQRHSQATLQETDKVQALMKEREVMEHRMEESRQQLNNIKSSWSEKITSLENQIHNLNLKTAEDQADLKAAEEQNSNLQTEMSALKDKCSSLEGEKADAEKTLSTEIAHQKEDIESLQWQLNNTTKEKDQEISALQERLKVEEEKYQVSSEKLRNKEEILESLELKCKNQESELAAKKADILKVKSDLQAAHSENKSLQDTVHKERTNAEMLEKAKLEIQSKLDTVSSEKNRLSLNLDEYHEKLTCSENCVKDLKEESQEKSNQISNLEARVNQLVCDCEQLNLQLKSNEEDLQHKIEESDTVKTLRAAMKVLEDELSEKKQALKVQSQRLADMKKTIQRELKLSTDTTDHTSDSRPELRPLLTSSPGPASLPAANNCQTGVTSMNGSVEEDGINNTYLKHVIIKYLTSREYEAVHLTRAVATLLHMTPEEEKLLRETLEWKMSWFGSKPNLGKGQDAKTIPPSQ